ncbi:MAG: SIMPL domain-containing protein [Methanotrichaceae archaeon]|nr:SIMPL domain-containing protein [Methanotrichaceae archaeon]
MKKSEIMLLGLMLLVASVLPACAQDNENVSKLIVQGEGKVFAAPDMVTIVLGVETRNASAAGAVAENAILMSNTTNALLEAGIEEKDIQTSTYSLTTVPEEEPTTAGREEETKPPEFIATNRVTVKLNNTEDVGRVLDAAVAAGSNNIQSISFDLRDPSPEKDMALTMAIEDASRKAGVAASAAGVELGRILEVSEGYSFVSARSEAAAFALAAPTTPISPGEIEVTASVTMTYEIS